MAREQDKYANVLSANVTTAGSTIGNQELTTGVSLGEGVGLLIDQIDYTPNDTIYTDFAAGDSGDYAKCAWSTQTLDASTEFQYDNSRVIHQLLMTRADYGTAGNAEIHLGPIVYKFDPAIIVASPKLFLNCICDAAISGGVFYSRIYFRYVKLSAQEYLELAESFVLMS